MPRKHLSFICFIQAAVRVISAENVVTQMMRRRAHPCSGFNVTIAQFGIIHPGNVTDKKTFPVDQLAWVWSMSPRGCGIAVGERDCRSGLVALITVPLRTGGCDFDWKIFFSGSS